MSNGFSLLQAPFCNTWAFPDADPAATRATTWVSFQLCTTPFIVPSHTWPLPWTDPKLAPVIVTCVVPGVPVDGDTVEIVAVLTLKVTGPDQTPPCRTRAVPEVELEATVAT